MNKYVINLKKQISEGNLKDTIADLQELAKHTPLLNNVILQSTRLSHLSKDIQEGVIRFDDIQIERNKITKALLSLIDEIDFEIKGNDDIKIEVDEFIDAFQKLKKEEGQMSIKEKKERFTHFDNYGEFLNSKSPEDKFKLQKLNSEVYLKQFGLTIKTLKEKLSSINYYNGEIDNEFTTELANSLEIFQIDNSMRHIDGFFGELTYDMLVIRLKEKESK